MAQVLVAERTLKIKMSPIEKLAALHGDITVPLDSIISATVEVHPWTALRGLRAPGTGFPGVIAYGIRRYSNGKDFSAILTSKPIVRIDLEEGSPYGRLLVTVQDPQKVIDAINSARKSQ